MFGRISLAGAGVALVAASVVFLATATRWETAEALTNCSTSGQAISGTEQQLMTLINNHRAANGAAPLAPSPNLFRAAAWMAEDMTANGYFSHTDSLGRGAFTRVQHCGYPGNGAGENIAGTSSAAGAFQLFVTSSGHNNNMLNPMWKVIGVGQKGSNWVVNFGSIDDSSQPWDAPGAPPPPPPPATATPTAIPTAVPTSPSGGGSNPGGGFPNPGGGGSPPTSPAGAPTAPNVIASPTAAPTYVAPVNVPLKRATLLMISAE